MLKILGCRAQPTVCRKRLMRSVHGGLIASFCIYASAGMDKGLADQLSRWNGPIPRLSLSTLDGARISLKTPRDRIVIVHFFATWCEACGPELKALDRLRAELGDRVMVIGVDVGEPEARIRRYFEKSPVGFQIGLDADRSVARAWDVYALPSTFVLDRSLAPMLRASGDVDWNDAAVRRMLADAPALPEARADRTTGTHPTRLLERTTP